MRSVKITLVVIGKSDRDPWEWGQGLASFLQGEIRELSDESTTEVSCEDVEIVRDEP